MRSSTTIKTVEKDLLAHILDTPEKATSFAWTHRVGVYTGHGGRQSPWSFLHSQRRKAFEKFLSKKSGESTTAGEFYEDMVYSSAEDCSFIRDYTGFIAQESSTKEDDFLGRCVMKESSRFNAPKLRDYILAMGEATGVFSHFSLPEHLKTQKLALIISDLSLSYQEIT